MRLRIHLSLKGVWLRMGMIRSAPVRSAGRGLRLGGLIVQGGGRGGGRRRRESRWIYRDELIYCGAESGHGCSSPRTCFLASRTWSSALTEASDPTLSTRGSSYSIVCPCVTLFLTAVALSCRHRASSSRFISRYVAPRAFMTSKVSGSIVQHNVLYVVLSGRRPHAEPAWRTSSTPVPLR